MRLHEIKSSDGRDRIVGPGHPCPGCGNTRTPTAHHACFRNIDGVNITPCYCECEECRMENRSATHVHYCPRGSIGMICQSCRDGDHITPGGRA